MIGRILASARRRRFLIEPHAVRLRRSWPQRPGATRLPKAKRQPTQPGELMAHLLATQHLCPRPGIERRQFTAIDVVSRYGSFGVRSCATATPAKAFLQELTTRMPVPIQGITRSGYPVDGGSAFMAECESACRARGIAVLDLPATQAAVLAWELHDNTERPHQALGYATPQHRLTQLLSHMP